MESKIVSGPKRVDGNMYHPPHDIWKVDVEGEQIDVRVCGSVTALGDCYHRGGYSNSAFLLQAGRAAEALVRQKIGA